MSWKIRINVSGGVLVFSGMVVGCVAYMSGNASLYFSMARVFENLVGPYSSDPVSKMAPMAARCFIKRASKEYLGQMPYSPIGSHQEILTE